MWLYVHIPFCVDRCQYCYYLSHDDRLSELDAYVKALVSELRLLAGQPALIGRALDCVYFGGGTPSILSTSRVWRLLEGLQEAVPWSAAREVSFECAPRSVTGEKMRVLRELGVTRISMGVQSMDDEVLKQNGRVHGADMIGVGSSAFSYFAGVSHQNQAKLDRYLAALSRKELPLWRALKLTDRERWLREFVLQLKLGRVERAYFQRKFGIDVMQAVAGPLDELERSGLLSSDDAEIRPTRAGLLQIDRLLPAFYPPEHRGIRYS